jgi:PAS domain S-box-containing protein
MIIALLVAVYTLSSPCAVSSEVILSPSALPASPTRLPLMIVAIGCIITVFIGYQMDFHQPVSRADSVIKISVMLLITVMLAVFIYKFLRSQQLNTQIQIDIQQKQRLRHIIDAVPCGILMIDTHGRIRELNEGLCVLLGYDRLSLLGESLTTILPDRYLQNRPNLIAELIKQAHDQPDGVNVSFKAVCQTGNELAVSVDFKEMQDGNELTLIASLVDISERRQHERQLQEAVAAAEAAARSKADFLANMSHEIRTPMNGIIGMTAIALETELTQVQREYLTMVQDSANYLLHLINDILDFSKMEAGKLQLSPIDFQIRDFLKKRLKILQATAQQKNLSFVIEVDQSVPDWLHGDPDRWIQVVINFVSNAIKFTEHGGITIAIKIVETRDDNLLLYCNVKDTGLGITQEAQQHIFDAFTQADNSTSRRYGGSGLGLSICRQLMDLMGGRIWVDSQPGQGSQFQLLVPFTRVATSSQMAEELAELDNILVGKKSARALNVLLAEDHPVNQKIAVEILKNRGHHITLAEDGQQALEHYAKKRYDLILMDVQMPGMDGESATAAIRLLERETGTHVRIIGLTAHALVGDKERLINIGMDGYLAKPFMPKELIAIVESFSADNQPMSAPVNLISVDNIQNLPVFNREEALERAMGQLPFLKKISSVFIDNLPAMRAQLQAAIDGNDEIELGRAAHRIKGAVANFSAPACVAVAKQLEDAALTANWREIAILINNWDSQVEKLVKLLKELD